MINHYKVAYNHWIYFALSLLFLLTATFPAFAANQTGGKNDRPIAVFVRQCNYSSASAHKGRPHGFSKEKCLYNLLDSIKDEKNISLVFFLDTFYPMGERTHFIFNQKEYPVIEFKGGTESASFLFMLDYIAELNLDQDTIVYLLEDDYLHLPNWPSIIREAFTLPRVDYVTLYDNNDKYQSSYAGLKSEIFHTNSCHWRTTPSTTNTYAMLFSTLERDFEIHKYFSLSTSITRDHAKFCELTKMGFTLVSSLPGYSCHLEPAYLSPCTDWVKMLQTIEVPRR